jgi:anti-sigma28 factor (negative regulator of flagellin synthesis)
MDAIDVAKVRRLRRALADGTFTIDPRRIAQAITGARPEASEPDR